MTRSQSDRTPRSSPALSSRMRASTSAAAHPTLLGRIVVVAPDRGDAAFERILRCLDDHHRNSGIEEVHRDAAAHGTGPDYPHLPDRQYRGVLGHVGDLPDLAFGKEHVALGA